MSRSQEHVSDVKKFPVLIRFYTRHQNVARLVEALRSEKPKVVYVSSDGPKTDEDWANVLACRAEIEKIDWPCRITKFYHDENLGMYEASALAKDAICQQEQGVVTLEDDCIPEENFFDYLRLVDSMHETDKTVPIYGGYNPVGQTPFFFRTPEPYTLSKRIRVWGHYMKASFWIDFRKSNPPTSLRVIECIQESLYEPGLLSKLWKLRILLGVRKGFGPGDVAMNIYARKNKLFCAVPSTSMIRNIGDGPEATNTKRLPDLFFKPKYYHDYSNTPKNLGKYRRRVDYFSGWLLSLWAMKYVFSPRKQ